MATNIQVVDGPDTGLSFAIQPGRTVRIGASARCAVCLSDTRIMGELEILCEDDIYRVTNNLETAVYLDGNVLSPGEARIWYIDAILQPSAVTRMALRLNDQPTCDFEHDETVRTLTAAGGNGARERITYVATAVLVVIAVSLLLGSAVPTIATQKTELWNSSKSLQSLFVSFSSEDLSQADRDSIERIISLVSQSQIASRRHDLSLEKQHYRNLRTEIRNLQSRSEEGSGSASGPLRAVLADITQVEQALNERFVNVEQGH